MNKALAFKEWQVVCEALGTGRQSLIFRKGGIHEGRRGFAFKEEDFLLFPTRFHSQMEQVIESARAQCRVAPEWEVGERLELQYVARAEWAKTLTDWQQVKALRGQHVWTENCLRERFDWAGKGMAAGSIHCALVRVFKMPQVIALEYEKGFGGCRSWLELPVELPEASSWRPVLGDVEHDMRRHQLDDVVGHYA